MMFLLIILGATDKRAPQGFAPLAIGMGLTLIHLISIPVTNTSVNPARSTGVAVFVGDWAVAQLWLFWVAPINGLPNPRVGDHSRLNAQSPPSCECYTRCSFGSLWKPWGLPPQPKVSGGPPE